MDRQARAARIRARERNFSLLRKAVVPTIVVYGLFIQRPKQYNFANYLAMRRKYEPSFDALFPPIVPQQKTSGLYSRHNDLGGGSDGTRDVFAASGETVMASQFLDQLEGYFVTSLAHEDASPVQLHFQSFLLFSIGHVMLTSHAGESKHLRFVGILGSFWKEI